MLDRIGAGTAIAMVLGGAARGQHTELVSVSLSGAPGNQASELWHAMTPDARYIAFRSYATDLVSGDVNGKSDAFLRDRQSGTNEILSVSATGELGNGHSFPTSISPDGRFVAFSSTSTNLVPSGTNGQGQIFVRDRLSGTNELVSVSSSGVEGDVSSEVDAVISPDGRYVAFTSRATNLVAGSWNGHWHIFLRDRQAGTTELVDVGPAGEYAGGDSGAPSISADGRYVAFASTATDLVANDTNLRTDVFVRDRLNDSMTLVSVSMDGAFGNGDSADPSITPDGRYVAFDSNASTLTPLDGLGYDVFVRDMQTGTTELVSVSTGGEPANEQSFAPSITADGKFVAFESLASNLVEGYAPGMHMLVLDRRYGTLERFSRATDGSPANSHSYNPSISADGRYVAFESYADNLIAGDTNGQGDVFIRDRGVTGFTSLCGPGFGGVRPCPCTGFTPLPNRGCGNSSTHDGAGLSASGAASLSADTLVFTTTAEKPTATSILLQGTTLIPSGAVYGQGVRCVGGTLKRLYVKHAVGGSITAPDFASGDPSVSARSAAVGNPIGSGEARWYLVFYRDPIVPGGCLATSTFNATQTGCVAWQP